MGSVFRVITGSMALVLTATISVLASDLTVDSFSDFAGQTNIVLQADGNVIFDGGAMNLPALSGPGQLTVQAGGDIVVEDGTTITAGTGWSVSLNAATGNITFNGSGALTAGNGNISLLASNSITVRAGFVTTTGGGSITAHALSGSIDAGSDAQGYVFKVNATTIAQAYNLNDGLGGISTAAGGDVSLTAGGDVTSVLPVSVGSGRIGYVYDGNVFSTLPSGNSDFATAGSGTYGSQPGNVTIVAGGNVMGHYLVANGTGSITTGVQMDANGNPITDSSGNYVLGSIGSAGTDNNHDALALSLINGGWNVTAAQDINLQEVRNPNGSFNTKGAVSIKHLFDYAPGDYVDLVASNRVTLGTSISLPRADTLNVPVSYPGSLKVTARAGGVVLGGNNSPFNQLILYPSPQGSLTINTTDGGSLTGNLPASGGTPQLFSIVLSDSSRHQYQASGNFGANDHAVTPVHVGSESPVSLNISGDMNLVALIAPEAAQVSVNGNMLNCAYQGMNLSSSDTTSISVTGDIINRDAFTSIDLSQVAGAQVPELSLLSQAVNNSISAATLSTSFFYDPATHLLTYQNISGQTLANALKALQNLQVQVYDDGVAQWQDPPFNTIPLTTTVSVINDATAQALLAKYNALGNIPTGGFGYLIGGGGAFNVSARNLDPGTTPGIKSYGVGLYSVSGSYPLANLFTKGADISLTLSSNLTMYSTAIASVNGGDIDINSGGTINIGSEILTSTSLGVRGIYSGVGGDISVVADGDVIVDGSRIAAYDGGNIAVSSLNGNVHVGEGDTGFVSLLSYKVDSSTHQVSTFTPTIPGSGILATTFPTDAGQTVGDIDIEAAQNIVVSCFGIVQTPLNGTYRPDAAITLHADGNIVTDVNNCPSVLGVGVDLTAGGFIGTILSAQVPFTYLTAVAGTDVQFSVSPGGIGAFGYQWFKDGTVLPDATGLTLSLTNIHRADAGTYSIVVSNFSGTVTNDIQLRVLVPQLLNVAAPMNNSLPISFSDADGGLHTALDIPGFAIETSTNLVDWAPANLPISTNDSRGLMFLAPIGTDFPQRFWRVLSE